jgi:hypothetical protein
MNKSELLNWLQDEYQQWEALIDQIDPARMDQPGVAAHWSMKDLIAHLTGWNRRLVAQLLAAQRGEPTPPPPWPIELQTDDEINAWIYEANRERSLREVLDETQQVFQQLLTVIEGFPDSVQIVLYQSESGREFHLVCVGDERFPAGEFFYHFHDDHEPDIRAWLARVDNQ